MRLALVCLLVGCSSSSSPTPAPAPTPTPTPTPTSTSGDAALAGSDAPAPVARLFTDAEVQRLADDTLAAITAAPATNCTAPAVGDPITGSSTQAVLALVTPTSPCLRRLAALSSQAVRDGEPDAQNVDRQCGAEIAAAVLHAAAFTSGCSPYVAGVRVMPSSQITLTLNLAHLMALHVKSSANARLLDATIRVMQDLARGRTSLLTAMLGVGGINIVARRYEDLAAKQTFSTSNAATTRKMLLALVASAPSFTDILAGERHTQALTIGLPLVEPPGWTPPGGPQEEPAAPEPGVHPHDVGAATLMAIAEAARADASACPAGVSIDACHRALVDAAAKRTAPTVEPWKLGDRNAIVKVLTFPLHADPEYAEKQQAAYERLATIAAKIRD